MAPAACTPKLTQFCGTSLAKSLFPIESTELNATVTDYDISSEQGKADAKAALMTFVLDWAEKNEPIPFLELERRYTANQQAKDAQQFVAEVIGADWPVEVEVPLATA